MKKTMMRLLGAMTALLLCAGCSGSDATATPTPSPTPTPTPAATMVATPTPALPQVDGDLPAFRDLQGQPFAEWPSACRMQFLHPSGIVTDAPGTLAQGDGFSLYLMSGLQEVSYSAFVLQDGRVFPQRREILDTGEGLFIEATTYANAADALDQLIVRAEADAYSVNARHDIEEVWDSLYGFDVMPERGHIAYGGEFAIMQDHNGFYRRLFALRFDGGIWAVTMDTYEAIAEPPMFQYLCSMLASLRFE
jgi:hypothetical protein